MLRRKVNSQPQASSGVNRSHPLAPSVVFCGVQLGGVYVDLVSGQIAQQFGTIDTATFPAAAGSRAAGEAQGLRPQASGYLQFAKQTGLDRLTTKGAVLSIAFSGSQHSGAFQYAVSSYEGVIGNFGFAFGFDDFLVGSDDGLTLRVSSAGGNVTTASGSVLGNPHNNKLHLIGASWDGTNNFFYHKSTTRSSFASTGVAPVDANRRTYINRMAASSPGTTGNVLCIGFDRVLTQAEYAAWAAQPWDILAPPARRLWAASAGVAGISGSAAQTQSANAAAASGSVATSGAAADAQALNSAAASGTVAVGGASSCAQALGVGAASATVTIGAASSCAQALNLSAASGTVTTAGSSSGTADQAAARNTSSAAGSVSISAAAADAQRADAAAASGTVSIDGTAAQLQAPGISVAAGNDGGATLSADPFDWLQTLKTCRASPAMARMGAHIEMLRRARMSRR